jgi:uncharacterized protein (TIGR00290 family)
MSEDSNEVVLYWSGGKDSALALHDLMTAEAYLDLRVTSLLTTFTEGYDRVSCHGVRRDLVEKQASYLAIDLHKTYIPKRATMAQYEAVIHAALDDHVDRGIRLASSGDIFVEKGRVTTIKKRGMKGCFPLWKRTTAANIRAYLDSGFKAYVVCVDASLLDESFVGRPLDEDFLNDLPPHVDPCGERGEYHTFVYDGPIFKEPIKCRVGDAARRESFYFADVFLDP